MARKTQEQVIEAIKSVAQSLGTEVLSQTQFFANSDITLSNVLRYFPNWGAACDAAGIKSDRSRDRIPDEELLNNWGLVTRHLGRIPSLTEYKLKGKYGRNPFDRFGRWVDLPDTFRRTFADCGEWEDVLAIIDQQQPKIERTKTTSTTKTKPISSGYRIAKLPNRKTYGEPIDFRGLRHEPVNEQGVVFLFGMVAHELGYRVEAIQIGFPDCEAKRRVTQGQWQTVQIEFEYESRNFLEHIRNPAKCDVIVCWKHNWEDCPDDIEVLELSEVIKKL